MNLNDSHALSTFPEALSTVKRLIKEYRRKLSDLLEAEWTYKSMQMPYLIELQVIYENVDRPRQVVERHLERLAKQLLHVQNKEFYEKGEVNLEKAKEVLITDILEFNRTGFTHCLWHEERTPSLKYNKKYNRVKCFGCGVSEDVVGVYQKVHNCSFKEAINKLST